MDQAHAPAMTTMQQMQSCGAECALKNSSGLDRAGFFAVGWRL
ncbi:hypothetical protein MICA_355 [Micavibrio aeruginosavorus ARL-13]|uniref:Uncharacterized protein n=1 Tax=Micavibrio aeruginosavorus (strain ARL-13) TaxID=856793 RepID=G2KR48_MICAA|nr:hypothetical protein MICA_355 [Micavibrio aeruginosavorus ARL-13]